jgi:hypothetical protein
MMTVSSITHSVGPPSSATGNAQYPSPCDGLKRELWTLFGLGTFRHCPLRGWFGGGDGPLALKTALERQ